MVAGAHFGGNHFGARIAASPSCVRQLMLQAPPRHSGLNLEVHMKKIVLTATLTAVAVLAVHTQPVAACGISNGVADGHGVGMLAATLVFALAAGTVTLFTRPQSAVADQMVVSAEAG